LLYSDREIIITYKSTESTKMLKAGFGRTDITPALGVRLGGYGIEERPAEEIFDNLHSTAMVLVQDNLRVVVINLDWICIEEYVVEQIRSDINMRTGIAKVNISVCTVHTHSAPNTLNFWGWGNNEDEYINSVLPKISCSVDLALEDLQEVEIGIATTESLVGVNRRSPREDGSIAMTANHNGSFDPTMTVMHFKTKDANSGFIVHYGAHCTAMGMNRLVSRDWSGIMKDRIESQLNAPALFLNGAIGDVGPRTNYLKDGGTSAGVGDGVESVREVGYRAATDAIRALRLIKEWRNDFKLNVLVKDIFLPYAPLEPLKKAESAKVEWVARKDEFGTPMCEYKHACSVIEAHKKEKLKGRTFTQTITQIGPVAIVPMPGEMFSEISLRIREQSPFEYTLCSSVSNGSLAYFPTQKARRLGGYECWVGKAIGPYLLADNIDDALVAENIKLLNQIKG
jgi:Neutral/alkaline non-lysosomal ceramidase, N-terminal